jgi:hypothetical protein
MSDRLAKVGGCSTWTVAKIRRCGIGRNKKCLTHSDYTGYSDSASRGETLSGKNMGMCNLLRDEHLRWAEQDFANGTLNPKYAFEAKMIDAWATALAALDDKPAPQSGRAVSLDFAGTYGEGVRVIPRTNPGMKPFDFQPSFVGIENVRFVNPFTDAWSCPSGAEPSQLLGRHLIDYPAFQCTSKPNLTGEPVFDFGGFADDRRTPIQDTSAACPTGFSETDRAQFVGAPGVDNALSFCWRRHVPGTSQPFLYGGAYSRGGKDGKESWVNPATTKPSCPNGFTSTFVHGLTRNDGRVLDHGVVMCWKASAPGDA